MNDIVGRLAGVVRRQGPRGLVRKVAIELGDRWFDWRRGTSTCQWARLEDLRVASPNKSRGTRYEPARVLIVRRLFSRLSPLLPERRVLVDFGCGKGRVLLVAAEQGFHGARGVEFSPELCAVARRNCEAHARTLGTACNFRVSEGDAVDYPIGQDENVFFFFNPFDVTVLARVLDNVVASLLAHRRPVFVCFYNPQYVEPMKDQPLFTTVMDLDRWGYRLLVFGNRPAPERETAS
jgi:SAM-dependent methyltransferase